MLILLHVKSSALPRLSLSSIHQQPTSPLFSPIQSKSTISFQSSLTHQADSSTAEQRVQTQTDSSMRQQSSHEHTGSSSATLKTGQSDTSERLKPSKQSHTGSKARKLGSQGKPRDTVRRNLQGSFQEEKISTAAMSTHDQWFPRDKQPFIKARSQAKPWK